MDPSVTCEICNKTFKEEKYLKQHQIRANCTKKHICNRCGKEFTRASNLREHLKRKNPCAPREIPVVSANNEENRCHYCNNTYSSKSNLNRHITTCSTKSNPYVMQQLISMVSDLQQQVTDLRQNSIQPVQQITNNIDIENNSELKKENNDLKENYSNIKKENKDLISHIEILEKEKCDNYIKAVHIKPDLFYEENLKKNLNNKSQWVYFIKEVRHEPRIKIGLTECLCSRISSISTNNSDKLEIIGYIETSDMKLLESEFHEYYVGFRGKGEWFELDNEQIFSDLDILRDIGELP